VTAQVEQMMVVKVLLQNLMSDQTQILLAVLIAETLQIHTQDQWSKIVNQLAHNTLNQVLLAILLSKNLQVGQAHLIQDQVLVQDHHHIHDLLAQVATGVVTALRVPVVEAAVAAQGGNKKGGDV